MDLLGNFFSLVSALGTTNLTVVKATAGYLSHVDLRNTAAAARYLKLFNKRTAPVLGTDVPVMTFYIPPTGGFIMDSRPFYFPDGISFALTVNPAANDTTALTAGDIQCMNMVFA